MRRFKVTRVSEVTGKPVSLTCDAESEADAKKLAARYTGLSPTLFRAVDIGPARNP